MAEFVPWNSRELEEWREKHALGQCIDLDGRSTHFLKRGQGEPLIMVHGFNMDLVSWLYNIDAFARHYTVYAIDLWGFGFSTREPKDYSFDLFVEQLRLFTETLDIKQAVMVGHSLGGGAIIPFTIGYPDRVSKLVLVGCVGLPYKMPERSKFFKIPVVPELLMGINNDFIRRKNLLDLWVYDNDLMTDSYFNQCIQFQKVKGSTRVLLKILRSDFFQTLGDDVDALGKSGLPILLLCGRHDRAVPISVSQELHRRMPGSTLKIFEETGHMPFFEKPDEFNQFVLDWLSSNAVGAGEDVGK